MTAPTHDLACIVGLGYVGLPLAVALAEAGHGVIGYDVALARVDALRAGRSGIEDISDARLQLALRTGLDVTAEVSDCASATTYVICVPTPLKERLPDLAMVEAAARALAPLLRRDDLVILESTTYPGTTEEVVAPLLEQGSGLQAGSDFLLAYSPERIDPGNPVYGITNTPKVVGGSTPEATDRACAFYERVVERTVRVSGTREAEMAKLLENTFRHINIALVNEMAAFCHELDVDLWESISAAATKPFGFMPFYPGPGVGGHCIPVDPSYLSWRVKKLGYQFRFVELAEEVNQRMPSYVVARLAELLNDEGIALSRANVLCIGAAYKPDVADCRESPALEVMAKLLQRKAAVRMHDPHVAQIELAGAALKSEPLTEASVASADAVVVLTAHRAVDWALVSTARLVLDTRAVVPHAAAVHRI